MSKCKIIALTALITLAFAVSVSPTALGVEKGKVKSRDVYFATNFRSAKVPHEEGHNMFLMEAKGMSFSEKWGAAVGVMTGTGDYTKGAGPCEGYVQWTYPDGSTLTIKYKAQQKGAGAGITGGAGGDGTFTYINGTGKFEGIKGGGTVEYSVLAPGQWYADGIGDYILP